MGLERHQWVGLLAGFPLFSGAWLSAFYNSPWPGAIGLLLTVAALFIAVRVEPRRSRSEHMFYGAVAGLLAGLVARLLGLVAGSMAGQEQMVQFATTSDLFRVVLAGDWLASFILVFGFAVLGALVALAEPESPSAETKTTTRKVKAKSKAAVTNVKAKTTSKSKTKARRK